MRENKLFLEAVVVSVLLLGTTTSVLSAPRNDQTSISLSIHSPDFTFGSMETTAGSFATIEIPTEGFTTVYGQARLPVIRKLVEIPQSANPTIRIVTVDWETTSLTNLGLPAKVIPLQPPVSKDALISSKIIVDTNYYAHDAFSTGDIAKIIYIGEIRGHRFALIEATPVMYNPVQGKLLLMRDCKLQIDLVGGDLSATSQILQRYSSPVFEQIAQSLFENYGQFEPQSMGEGRDSVGYLVIVYDTFYEEIQPWVMWKQSLGFTMTVTKTSQIPGGATNTNIRNYILNAYNNWPVPPTFVLLVGDTSYVPTYTTGLQSGVACTDLYYANMAGDYFPELFIGRFPAATEAQATNMVTKTLTYEQETYPGPEFLTKAVFMASEDNYQISEGTHNYVISTYLEPNQWQSDKLYSHTYGATTQQVKNAFNDGRILGVYSGHGSETSWADGPPFSEADVNSLTNLGEYPFVFSHACVTGTFTVGECFGETWLRAANKAGIFFWGASASTFWTEDDYLERDWFAAWWDDGIETIAGLCVQGMIDAVAQMGGPTVYPSQYYFEAYNILGDPSLQLDAIEFVWNNDVGAISINSPDSTAYAGSIAVDATIGNFGLNDQISVPVTCDIFTGGVQVYYADFEANNGGYTASGTTCWQWGVPTSGPENAHSGTKLWATILNGNYPNSANARLTSASIALPSAPTELSFWHWYNTESYYDGGNVKISTNNGVTWTILGSYQNPYPEDAVYSGNAGIPNEPCFSGTSGGWQKVTFDLSAYAGMTALLRWHFGSDSSLQNPGWYIDDVKIETKYGGTPVYSTSASVNIPSLTNMSIAFTPAWNAQVGSYLIKVVTHLTGDQKPSNDQVTKFVTILANTPPNTPSQSTGPMKGIINSPYAYTTSTTDPDGDSVYYRFSWGDQTTTDWLGPFASGTIVSASHAWMNAGIYSILTQAKDEHNAESTWSTPLQVRMYKIGDINGDNTVNLGDINPFVLALSAGEAGYYAAYPDGYYYTADINQDGAVNFGDINPFVALLSGGK